jgi:glycerophosphoryl diester phosphodiesterase
MDMRRSSVPGTLLSLAALCALVPAALAFDLQGHRGARGLAPENTLPAFERALELGVTTIELDIGVTADGTVVVAHDPALNPAITRDADGAWLDRARAPLLKQLTVAQLQRYDVGRIREGTPYAATFATQQPRDGTRIPTLAAVFDAVKARGASDVRFNIETKLNPMQPDETVPAQAMADALLRTIRAAGMERRVSIQSFDWRTLLLVQQQAPEIPTVHLTLQSANNDTVRDGTWTAGMLLADHGGSVPRLVKAAGGRVWSPNAAALTQASLKEAQGLGLRVIPWTVNQPGDMDRLIAWGVDGLITDYPDRLREAMLRAGLPLPRPLPSPSSGGGSSRDAPAAQR